MLPSTTAICNLLYRYADRFARIDGEWQYTWRDYTPLDFTGDMSRHLK